MAGAEPAARIIWLIPCTCRRRGRVMPAVNHPHPGCQMTPTPTLEGGRKTGCHRLGQTASAPRHKRESSVPSPTRHAQVLQGEHSEAGGRRTQREQQRPGKRRKARARVGPVGAERRAVREGGPGGRRGPLGKKAQCEAPKDLFSDRAAVGVPAVKPAACVQPDHRVGHRHPSQETSTTGPEATSVAAVRHHQEPARVTDH